MKKKLKIKVKVDGKNYDIIPLSQAAKLTGRPTSLVRRDIMEDRIDGDLILRDNDSNTKGIWVVIINDKWDKYCEEVLKKEQPKSMKDLTKNFDEFMKGKDENPKGKDDFDDLLGKASTPD